MGAQFGAAAAAGDLLGEARRSVQNKRTLYPRHTMFFRSAHGLEIVSGGPVL